jgi:hypothetical protein
VKFISPESRVYDPAISASQYPKNSSTRFAS